MTNLVAFKITLLKEIEFDQRKKNIFNTNFIVIRTTVVRIQWNIRDEKSKSNFPNTKIIV